MRAGCAPPGIEVRHLLAGVYPGISAAGTDG